MYKIISAAIQHNIYVLLVICLGCLPVCGQQYVIANKDNTHPEIKINESSPAFITNFSVLRRNGYNEISWSALREKDIRKYIVEYSFDGINYETASETLASNGSYSVQHQLMDFRPIIYRIKMQFVNNSFLFRDGVAVDGVNVSPVQIYPTIIQGNTININASWPVERILITSGSGAQIYAKDINGQKDLISIAVPPFGKGLYWMTFYGKGWKTTTKFIVP